MYVQANINRNIDVGPMDDGTWDRFIGAVSRALLTNTDGSNRVLEVHRGAGEGSAHLSVIGADAIYTRTLKAALSDLRNWYLQESITLIISQSEMI